MIVARGVLQGVTIYVDGDNIIEMLGINFRCKPGGTANIEKPEVGGIPAMVPNYRQYLQRLEAPRLGTENGIRVSAGETEL